MYCNCNVSENMTVIKATEFGGIKIDAGQCIIGGKRELKLYSPEDKISEYDYYTTEVKVYPKEN
jgi:hypothetical protein